MDLEELWIPIEGYSNYAVNNYGQVINLNRDTELTPVKDARGALKVYLYRNNVPRTFYIHRLVAKAFFLNYTEEIDVKHKNNNLSDNSVLNLTLVERKWRKKV